MKEKEEYEKNYLTQNNIEESQISKKPRKRVFIFNLNKNINNNIQEKLRYINDKNIGNNNKIKQNYIKSLGMELSNKLNKESENKEDKKINRKFILYTIKEKIQIKMGK